jgi:hypothetical protein
VTASAEEPQHGPRPPAPLTVAVSLTGVEAVVFVLLAVAELADFDARKAAMGITTALFFLAYGIGLALCAWAVWRLHSWGRAPIVVAQLIQLLVAWSFRGGETTWVAVALAVGAGVVLAGIFHPDAIEALADES